MDTRQNGNLTIIGKMAFTFLKCKGNMRQGKKVFRLDL